MKMFFNVNTGELLTEKQVKTDLDSIRGKDPCKDTAGYSDREYKQNALVYIRENELDAIKQRLVLMKEYRQLDAAARQEKRKSGKISEKTAARVKELDNIFAALNS